MAYFHVQERASASNLGLSSSYMRPKAGSMQICKRNRIQNDRKTGHQNHNAYIGKRIGEQALNGEQYLGNGQCKTPVMLDDVDAHVSVSTHVRMNDFGEEAHLKREQSRLD